MKKALFYLISFTWGLPMTLAGIFAAAGLRLAGHKTKKWGWCRYFEIGEGWGGCELGLFFVVNRRPSDHIRNHEHGHALQNCLWGPLMPFIICIPSFLRYHYRRLVKKRHPERKLPNYDAIWFEGQATDWGTRLLEREKERE